MTESYFVSVVFMTGYRIKPDGIMPTGVLSSAHQFWLLRLHVVCAGINKGFTEVFRKGDPSIAFSSESRRSFAKIVPVLCVNNIGHSRLLPPVSDGTYSAAVGRDRRGWRAA